MNELLSNTAVMGKRVVLKTETSSIRNIAKPALADVFKVDLGLSTSIGVDLRRPQLDDTKIAMSGIERVPVLSQTDREACFVAGVAR